MTVARLLRSLLVCLVIVLALAPLSAHAATPSRTCTVTDLGTLLGGSTSQAAAINTWSQVVGAADTVSGTQHAALWDERGIHDLGILPGGSNSTATAINNWGQVVGAADTVSGTQHAVLWEKDGIHDLGILPGGSTSQALAINDAGQAVGYADTISGTQHAVLWDHGAIHDLGTLPGGSTSQALAINNWGQAVGYSDAANGGTYPVLWEKGSIRNLGAWFVSLNKFSVAAGINNRGQVVGVVGGQLGSVIIGKATRWLHGVPVPLQLPLAYSHSQALSINDRGQVFGDVSANPYGVGTRFVLWETGRMTLLSLDALPGGPVPSPATSPVFGSQAFNDGAQFVSSASTASGAQHAARWQC